jgi:hypothetical protein
MPTDASTASDHADASTATRVVLSYPADLSKWGRDQVATPHFRNYLGKVHDTAAVGDAWAEFVGVGCCGDALDVTLQVEQVDGGDRIADDTAFEYEVREACDVQGGWKVQSADGPTQ